jgi:hypothetical protein
MKLFIIGLFVSFFPIQAIAGGFTGFHQIDWLYQRNCSDSRGLEIQLSTRHDNPDQCTNARVLEVRCGTRPYRAAVAISLTAFSGDYWVRAFVNGCDDNGHAIVRALQMQKTQVLE